MTEPAVAVAISTRDRPASLRRCLASLRAGTTLPTEVVVSDQSSGEATRAIVDAASACLPIRYIRARPGGLGAAQNDAFAATASPVVAVLDDDCVADETWLAEIARLFESDPDVALVAGRVLPLAADGPNLYPVSSRLNPERREFSGKAVPWDVGSGNNFAIQRSWFERIGGCDERLGPGAPLRGGLDMDLFYRVLRAGGLHRYEPAGVVGHARSTRDGRIARRSAYGFGMAAAAMLWLRQGDWFAWRVIGEWLGMRCMLLLRALGHGRWQSVYEEVLVLQGTTLGLIRGLRPPAGAREA